MSQHLERRRAFKERLPSIHSSNEEDSETERPRKRRANVYDAVAGRVTQGGFIDNVQDSKASKQRLRPDEVLFRQPNAPTRYEETDYYFAHEKLPADQQLPSSDMLSSIHAYVSNLYLRTAQPGTEKTFKCMDETALIALGILMEETARSKLGETGDLAFTEAAEPLEDESAASGEDDAIKKTARSDHESTLSSSSRSTYSSEESD